jgi:hypothetical protein
VEKKKELRFNLPTLRYVELTESQLYQKFHHYTDITSSIS